MLFLRCKLNIVAQSSDFSIISSIQARFHLPPALYSFPSGTADAFNLVRPFMKMNHSLNADWQL